MPNPVPSPIHVYFALLPGSLVLDWAGPAEALRIAQRMLADGIARETVVKITGLTADEIAALAH